MPSYKEKGVLQIPDNFRAAPRNGSTEGASGISQFNSHHPIAQFTGRETKVTRGKASTYTRSPSKRNHDKSDCD